MGEFIAVLGMVFFLQLLLIAGLTLILIKRGYLPRIFHKRGEIDLSFAELGQVESSSRAMLVYAEGYVDALDATLSRIQIAKSTEVPMRMFSGGSERDPFSSRVLGHGIQIPYSMTTKTPLVRKMEAA